MIWNAMIIAMFSWAAYLDGEQWKSGLLAGVAISVAYTALKEWLLQRTEGGVDV